MAYEMKNNTASIFKNYKKEKNSHPDMKGEALIDGKSYWVSAWRKEDKNNNAWFSIALTEKGQNKPVMDNTPAGRDDKPNDVQSDEIPW